MDNKDKKILYELAENARESRNVLAKKVGMSREVLDYRIKKLQKEGIITGFQARINISNFVYGGYIILIQTIGLNKEKERLIINKIKNQGKTQFMGKIGGSSDYIIGFTVKSLNDLADYVQFVNNTFSRHKSKVSFFTMIKEIKDSFKGIFSSTEDSTTFVSMPSIKEKKELDMIDKEILSFLGKDCGVPSWKIADKLKISDVAIRNRIKKLQDKNIILNYRTMVDLTKLEYQPHYLFLKTNIKNESDEKNLRTHFQTNNLISYATKIIGGQDYIIAINVKNNVELKDYIQRLRDSFESILEVDSFPIFEMIYHTQLAEDFLK